MDPVFVRTRWEYGSYQDYWRLVDLAGFETCYVDEIDLEREVFYIVTPINGEFRPHITNKRAELGDHTKACKVVWWNLERPDGGRHEGMDVYESAAACYTDLFKYTDAIWASDRFLAGVFKDSRSVYVTLGSHEDLVNPIPFTGYQWDIAHMSYINYRRERLLRGLIPHNVRQAPNAWGVERNRILHATRAMLNIHQTESKISEPLRIALAAAYRMPYLTEFCQDLYPLVEGKTCVSAHYNDLPHKVPAWLRNDLAPLGHKLHELLTKDMTFRDGVLDGVHKTLEVIK